MAEHSDKPLITLPGLELDGSQAENGLERRFTPRYPFTAAAEVFELRSQARINGRTSDVGLGGCYIDSISPFPVGTVVRARLERESRKFEATARITYAHPSMGMGMKFTEIKPEYMSILQTWLAEMSGETPPIFDTQAEDAQPPFSVAANTIPVLNELINMLVRKKIISEVEGTTLLRQMFH